MVRGALQTLAITLGVTTFGLAYACAATECHPTKSYCDLECWAEPDTSAEWDFGAGGGAVCSTDWECEQYERWLEERELRNSPHQGI